MVARVAGTLAFALALIATAQPAEPILHEYVAPPADRIVQPQATPGVTGGGTGQNPTAIRQGEKLLPEPAAPVAPGAGETTFGTEEFGADRMTEERPDRTTAADDRLHYVEVFNPSVVPFKRMSALDGVREDYTLYVRHPTTRALRVGGQTSPDRDLFWASLLIDLQPGRQVAIPSVAPDMRVLSYETQPPTRLEFSKDGADNFYVVAEEVGGPSAVRLVFLADAAATYFAAPIPKGYKVADAAASEHLRPLPARQQRSAQVMLDILALDRSTPLDVAVNKLVAYYRGFDAGAPPPSSGDIFLDLAKSKRGVCRHRAFCFVVTANALGIPARFVANEAHAFVEVWVPEVEWLRVDLGGEALHLDVSNAGGKTLHRPRTKDPFPTPPGYAEDYTRLHGDIRGLSPQQIEDAQEPTGDPDAPDGAGKSQGNGNGAGPGRKPKSPLSPAPGTKLPQAPPGTFPGQTETKIRVTAVDEVGYRGESIRVSGRVEAVRGGGVPNVRVNVWFAPAGNGGDGARFLGQTVTAADGSFSVGVELPADLNLGKHEVYASTEGDKTYGPSLSQ